GPAGIAGAAGELGRYGADRILVSEGEHWAQYGPEHYTAALASVIGQEQYFAVFLAATSRGKDLAPRLAARLDLPLATEATALSVDGGDLIVTRPLYAGKVFSRVKLHGSTRLVSLRPNAFGAEENPRAGAVESLGDLAPAGAARLRVREFIPAASTRP